MWKIFQVYLPIFKYAWCELIDCKILQFREFFYFSRK